MSFPLQLWQALLLGIILVLFLAYIIISTIHEVARYRVFPQIADRYPIIRKYGWDQPPKRESFVHDGAGAKRNRRFSEEHLQQHIHQMGGNVEIVSIERGTQIQMVKIKHQEFLEGTHATNLANMHVPPVPQLSSLTTTPLPAAAISTLAVGAEIPAWAQADNREVLEETVTKKEKNKKQVAWRTSQNTDSYEDRKEGDHHHHHDDDGENESENQEDQDDEEEEDSQQSGSGDGSGDEDEDDDDDGEEGEESGSREDDEESDEEGTSDDGSVGTRSAVSSNATDVTDVSVGVDRKPNTSVKPALRITAATPSPGTISPRVMSPSPSPGAPTPKFSNKPKPKKSTLSTRLCGGLLAPSRAVAAQSAGPSAPMPKLRASLAATKTSPPRKNYVQPSSGPKSTFTRP